MPKSYQTAYPSFKKNMLYSSMLKSVLYFGCLSVWIKGLIPNVGLSQHNFYFIFQKFFNVTQQLLSRMSVCLYIRTYPCLTKCVILLIKGINPYIGLSQDNYFLHFHKLLKVTKKVNIRMLNASRLVYQFAISNTGCDRISLLSWMSVWLD